MCKDKRETQRGNAVSDEARTRCRNIEPYGDNALCYTSHSVPYCVSINPLTPSGWWLEEDVVEPYIVASIKSCYGQFKVWSL